jgi:hypothetical protein
MMVILCTSCGKKTPVKERKAEKSSAAATQTDDSTPGVAPAEKPPQAAAITFPVSLVTLQPSATEYGTLPDPENISKSSGAGVIDTTPVAPRNNAQSFWPGGVKIVARLPPDDFAFTEGQNYQSAQTEFFASEGFFVAGVGLWGRTRNMYHWLEYDIPEGSSRFTGEVLICDDSLGWFVGMREWQNQQFTFFAQVDGKTVARQGVTRHNKKPGSGEKLMSLDIPLPPGAKKIRFALELTPWGAGNRNVELVITDGLFRQ